MICHKVASHEGLFALSGVAFYLGGCFLFEVESGFEGCHCSIPVLTGSGSHPKGSDPAATMDPG